MKLAGKLETTLAFPIRVEEVHVWQLVCGFRIPPDVSSSSLTKREPKAKAGCKDQGVSEIQVRIKSTKST